MTHTSLFENSSFCNSRNAELYAVRIHAVIDCDIYDEHPGLATYEVDSIDTSFVCSIQGALTEAEMICQNTIGRIKYIEILDSENKLVLGAEVKENQLIWTKSLLAQKEIQTQLQLIEHLRSEASIEFSYDNRETGRSLTQKASILSLALIDEKYKNHPDVIHFLQKPDSSEHISLETNSPAPKFEK